MHKRSHGFGIEDLKYCFVVVRHDMHCDVLQPAGRIYRKATVCTKESGNDSADDTGCVMPPQNEAVVDSQLDRSRAGRRGLVI